jgi:predicted NUDIX family phosphoesterase
MKRGEKVLVFPAHKLSLFKDNISKKIFPGLTTEETHIQTFLNKCLNESFFTDRAEAEENPKLKQIIPYCVVRTNPTDGSIPKFFLYKRSKKGGENRLHEKWSLGVGGHINPEDGYENHHKTFGMALQRELAEELDFQNPEAAKDIDYEIMGLLYDNSDSVGQVHFGVVVDVKLPEGLIPNPNNREIDDYKWLPFDKLLDIVPQGGHLVPKYNLESWSECVLVEILSLILQDMKES